MVKVDLIHGYINFRLINLNNYQIINLTNFLSVTTEQSVATGCNCTYKLRKREDQDQAIM